MKLLLALGRPLFPANTGGQIRSLSIFSRLAKRMEIHCVSLASRERDAQHVAAMEKLFASYTPVFWDETPKFSPRFYLDFLRSRLGPLPYFLAKYCRPELARVTAELMLRHEPDLLLCDFLHLAAALKDVRAPRRVVFQHNVEYVIRKRHWETETHPLKKWLLRAEWQKARAVESEVCRTFDHVITVSEGDREAIAREFGVAHVSDLPTGVDGDYFQPTGAQQRAGNLVFVGSMDWHPNEDGIAWFLSGVYPLIRRRAPHATLTVVGRNPSARLAAMAAADSSVEITGTVPDVRPYLERAEVVLVPLRIGGGTRIKIYEAMAMGRAVVSTTLGAEGLPLVADREIVLRDAADEFAAAVCDLLADSSKRNALAAAGRARVTREFTWERVASRMEDILLRAAAQGIAHVAGAAGRLDEQAAQMVK